VVAALINLCNQGAGISAFFVQFRARTDAWTHLLSVLSRSGERRVYSLNADAYGVLIRGNGIAIVESIASQISTIAIQGRDGALTLTSATHCSLKCESVPATL